MLSLAETYLKKYIAKLSLRDYFHVFFTRLLSDLGSFLPLYIWIPPSSSLFHLHPPPLFWDSNDMKVSLVNLVLQVLKDIFFFPVYFCSVVQIGDFFFFCFSGLIIISSVPSVPPLNTASGLFILVLSFSFLKFPFVPIYIFYFYAETFYSFTYFKNVHNSSLKHFYSSYL